MDIILRGSIAWDQHEFRRRAQGHRCICFGVIPDGQAFGEPHYKVQGTGRHNRRGYEYSPRLNTKRIIRYFEEMEQ